MPNNSLARKMGIHNESEAQGFDLHLSHRPTDKVWTMTERGLIEQTVIRVRTEHRSVLSDHCVLESNVTYVLANGLERSDKQVFGSKEELIQSL